MQRKQLSDFQVLHKVRYAIDESFISIIEKERQKSDNLMNKLIEDDEVKNFLLKKIVEKGLDKTLLAD